MVAALRHVSKAGLEGKSLCGHDHQVELTWEVEGWYWGQVRKNAASSLKASCASTSPGEGAFFNSWTAPAPA